MATVEPTEADLKAERAVTIAEAKLLVKRLDMYLEWIGEWAVDGDANATH